MRFLFVLFIFITSSAFAARLEYLSQVRGQITLPDYTPEQNLLLAQQAEKILIGLNGNLLSRQKTIGVDPTEAMAQLVIQASAMKTETLQLKISELFRLQRDGHLNFNFPAPYRCYISGLPFYFAPFANETGKSVVAVRVKETDILLASTAPYNTILPQIDIGDFVVNYDGKPIEEALRNLHPISMGHNPDALRSRAINALYYRFHGSLPVPEKDSVVIEFQKKDGTRYTVDVPWYEEIDDACITPAPKTPDTATVDYADESFPTGGDSGGTEIQFIQPIENGLGWGTFEDANGKFGYIKLTDFNANIKFANKTAAVPDLAVARFAQILHRLEHEFQVQGLIIDLRRNSGGNISYAEALVQLFTPNLVQQSTFRLKNGTLWKQFALEQRRQGKTWFERTAAWLLNPLNAHNPYTVPVPFSNGSVDRNNSIAQRFHQPVALYVDAICFSSCEQFTAKMKDNGSAIVYGEQRLVSGGGGNVWGYDVFQRLFPSEFPALPGGQTMRSPTYQTLRSGKAKDVVMEEVPLAVDIIKPKLLKDLQNGVAESFDDITTNLKSKYDAQFKVSLPLDLFFPVENLSQDHQVPATIQGIDTLKVVNGLDVTETSLNPSQSLSQVTLPKAKDLTDVQYEISGYRNGIQKFRHQLILTAAKNQLVLPPSTQNLTGKDLKPFAQVNSTLLDSGWKLQNDQWHAGRPEQKTYANMEYTTLRFHVQAPQRETLSLSIDGLVETTSNQSDLFVVQLTDSQGKVHLLGRHTTKVVGNGEVPTNDTDNDLYYNLNAFAGQSFQLDLIFVSDFVRAEGIGTSIQRLVFR